MSNIYEKTSAYRNILQAIACDRYLNKAEALADIESMLFAGFISADDAAFLRAAVK